MKTEILFLAGMCLCACSRTPQEQTSFPSVKVVHAEVMEAPSSRCYTFISQPYRLSELSFRVGGPVHAFDVQQGQFFRKGQLIAAIDENMNHIWRCRGQRKWMKTLTMYSTVLGFGPLLAGGSLLLSSQIKGWAFWDYALISSLGGGLLDLLPYLLSLGGILLLYKVVPNVSVRWKHALIGATSAALLFEIAKEGFGYYIAHYGTYKSIYGALAGIPIMMIWLYMSWLVVLLGAEFTATLGEWQSNRTLRGNQPH